MARKLDLAEHLHVDIGDAGVAELVFGPEGGMPRTRGCERGGGKTPGQLCAYLSPSGHCNIFFF